MIIKLYYDHNCESPREGSNIGTMLCNHRRYSLGDKSNPEAGRHGSYEEDFKTYIRSEYDLTLNDIIYTPIYVYEHSGIVLSSTPFSCSFDSGQLGFNYCTKEQVRKKYNIKRISSKLKDKVIDILNVELEIYNNYVQGDCYGFQVLDGYANYVDGCSGFIGDLDDVKKEIKEYIDKELYEQLDTITYNDIEQ